MGLLATARSIGFMGQTEAVLTPSAPTKCNTSNGAFWIEALWFDTSDNETGFTVEWSVNGGAFGEQQDVAAEAESVIYAGTCFNGSTYAVRVRSYNGSGFSTWCTDATPVTATNCV